LNRKACSQFIELWKQKHETGQWIVVEPEAMSARSEFSPFNASGIVFMGDNMKQTMELGAVPNVEANGEDGAKSGIYIVTSSKENDFYRAVHEKKRPKGGTTRLQLFRSSRGKLNITHCR
jgi:hypothetical protein